MTEVEWLAHDRPAPLLDHVWRCCTRNGPQRGYLNRREAKRKFRLFGCAVCRRWRQWLLDPRSLAAVEVAERFADGLATREDREAANRAAREAMWHQPTRADRLAVWMAVCVCEPAKMLRASLDVLISYARTAAEILGMGGKESAIPWRERKPHGLTELALLAELCRDLFGNPFHPARIDPTWRTPSVLQLSASMYEERNFEAMPILADALEEAGCDNTAILEHCRGPMMHARGCWVIDLLRGRQGDDRRNMAELR